MKIDLQSMRQEGVAVIFKVPMLTEEFVVDLGSFLSWGKSTAPSL
jgi:hypothetical protein